MGSRDYRHHEPKKPKKNAKKLPPVTILQPPVQEVAIIRKARKPREVEEEPEETEA